MIRAFAFHRHAVDALDDRSRHRVDDPLVLVLLGFQVSVGHRTAGMLPGKVLCLKRRTDFLAGVTGVPLVHNVSEWCKLIVPFESVHTVIQSNQPGVVLPQHFHISADLQIVTTKAAHVLYDNDRDSVSFDFSNHLLKAGTVELRTRDTIVRKVDAVGKTVLFGVVLQYSLLRWNLSRGFSAKHNVSENSVQNICRAVSPQRMRIIGSMVFFYL